MSLRVVQVTTEARAIVDEDDMIVCSWYYKEKEDCWVVKHYERLDTERYLNKFAADKAVSEAYGVVV